MAFKLMISVSTFQRRIRLQVLRPAEYKSQKRFKKLLSLSLNHFRGPVLKEALSEGVIQTYRGRKGEWEEKARWAVTLTIQRRHVSFVPRRLMTSS
jgi:hypothetical protein